MLVVVLAGGASSRMGGGDKTQLRLGDRSLLDHVLGWLPEETCLVVGEQRPLHEAREVIWVREPLPGRGPVPAIHAALHEAWQRELPVGALADDEVAVLAGDAPLAPRAVPRLRAALASRGSADVALLVDSAGRRQHLCAVWRRAALGKACGQPGRTAVRELLEGREVVEVAARGDEALDCDDPGDLAYLRRAWREPWWRTR